MLVVNIRNFGGIGHFGAIYKYVVKTTTIYYGRLVSVVGWYVVNNTTKIE